jgi:acetyl esterase/lipase
MARQKIGQSSTHLPINDYLIFKQIFRSHSPWNVGKNHWIAHNLGREPSNMFVLLLKNLILKIKISFKYTQDMFWDTYLTPTPQDEARCLHISVFAPDWESVEFKESGRPVIVFVHGGGFLIHSAANYGDWNICQFVFMHNKFN